MIAAMVMSERRDMGGNLTVQPNHGQFHADAGRSCFAARDRASDRVLATGIVSSRAAPDAIALARITDSDPRRVEHSREC